MVLIPQIRQSEYTGENRCIPCTGVNVMIAAIGSSLIAAFRNRRFGSAVFGFSLGVIYLRGYLLPGTPELTKRYLPDRVLRWFDKEPMATPTESATNIDPEQVLYDAGVVTPCREGTDLCLTDEFQIDWYDRMRTIRGREPGEEQLIDVLDIHSDRVSFAKYGNALTARNNGNIIGQWNSPAAVVADVAAANALARRLPQWEKLDPAETAHVLRSLRVFIETCPQCGGPVRIDEEVVDSCCRSYDVVRSSCRSCESPLFEIEWEGQTV